MTSESPHDSDLFGLPLPNTPEERIVSLRPPHSEPPGDFTGLNESVTAASGRWLVRIEGEGPAKVEEAPAEFADAPTGGGSQEVARDVLALPQGFASVGPEYVLMKIVGQGGMGEVWMARQVSLEREIAVKRLRSDPTNPKERSQVHAEFRQEALLAARLSHPNIVPIHDVGLDGDGRPLIAMKLVNGQPWQDVIRGDWRRLSAADFLAKHLPIFIQVAQAVGFAHARGIVHRDLKVNQVMLGEFGEVLLMDWGLAMVVGTPDKPDLEIEARTLSLPTRRTAPNPAGTPAMMAPEQTEYGAQNIGPWTDIYLLGGILYNLLCGQLPHGGVSTQLALGQARRGEFTPAPQRDPDRFMPPELVDLCDRAMSKQPTFRPKSVREIIDDIQGYLTGASRRREAEEQIASLRDEMAVRPPTDYAAVNELWSRLTRARDLWPGNPSNVEATDSLLESHARLAIDSDDLALARVQVSRVLDADRRDGVAKRLKVAEDRREARERQRRLLILSTFLLLLFSSIGLASFLINSHRQNLALVAAQEQAERQRDRAEAQAQIAMDMLAFVAKSFRTEVLAVVSPTPGEGALDLEQIRRRVWRVNDSIADEMVAMADKVKARLAVDPEDIPIYTQALLNVSRVLADLGRLEEAKRRIRECRAMLKQQDAIDSEQYFLSTIILGNALISNGEFKEAEETLTEGLERLQVVNPTNYETRLGMFRGIIRIAHERGDTEKARKLTVESIELLESLPEEQLTDSLRGDLINSYSGLGSTLVDLEDREGAMKAFEHARDLLKSIDKPEADLPGNIYNNLARLMMETGNLQLAEVHLKLALESTEAVNGPDHWTVATIVNNLASTLRMQGKSVEALPLYKRSLAMVKKSLGPDHPFVARALMNTASLAFELELKDESLAYAQEALAIARAHPDSDAAMGDRIHLLVVEILIEKDDFAGALAMMDELEASKGPGNPLSGPTLFDLTIRRLRCYNESSMLKEAAETAEVLGRLLEETKLPDSMHQLRSAAMRMIAHTKLNAGDHEGALALMDRAAADVGSHPKGGGRLKLAVLREKLDFLVMIGTNREEAEKLAAEIKTEINKSLGPEHPETRSINAWSWDKSRDTMMENAKKKAKTP